MPLSITEFGAPNSYWPGGQVVALGTPLATQEIVLGNQSAAFNAGTRLVRLCSSEACRVAFGADPTAGATSMRLPADTVEVFEAVPGQKLSVIAA